MAEDRKPKIDLKSRLQKMGGQAGPTPNSPATGSVPVPSRVMSPAPTHSSVPPPPGMTEAVRPATTDPGNRLAAVSNSFPPPAAIAAVPQPHRLALYCT